MSSMEKAYQPKKIEYNYAELKASLLRRFLYKGDSEALQILLNLYKIDESIENIFPSYVSLKSLRKDIEGFLYYKEGKELIAANLSQLIHDDINRFELIMYLEGYRRGMSACKEVNELEILALKYFTVPELYNRKSLFHYDRNLEEIGRFRRWVTCNIHNDVSFTKNYVDQVSWYNRRVLKKKIKHLNTHLDRQIMINYDSKEDHYRESDSHLSTKELYGLSKKLYRFLHRDALKIYHRAYWNGLNDQVLKRYR